MKTLENAGFQFKGRPGPSIPMNREGLYTLVSVVDGKGAIKVTDKEYPLEKGDHFLLPHKIDKWELTGDLHIIASHP